MQATQYKVLISPRTSDTTYADPIDVSAKIKIAGLGAITQSIDSGDYNVGIFTYSDLTITANNSDGYFNDVQDSRSMFPYLRDLAKVEVEFFQGIDSPTITYRGIINDEATTILPNTEEIQFLVLSPDSIIRKAQVAAGSITDGMTLQIAIFTMLNVDIIKKVLTIDVDDLDLDFNGTVEDGSQFDDTVARDSVNELLLASNSLLFIDENYAVSVRGRQDNGNVPLYLFGPGDLKGRCNIIDMPSYNTGLQRVFNSFKINSNHVANDETSIAAYTLRQKEISFPWATLDVNIDTMTATLLAEFHYPKIELEVTITTEIAKDYSLLDLVSVDFPLKVFPWSSTTRIPICGAFKAGDPLYPLPKVVGAIKIDPKRAFKIIEITEDTSKFLTTLKLREIGTGLNDSLTL